MNLFMTILLGVVGILITSTLLVIINEKLENFEGLFKSSKYIRRKIKQLEVIKAIVLMSLSTILVCMMTHIVVLGMNG